MFIPLSLATLAAHWSLVRSRGHYMSDVLAGGGLGIAVGLAAWKLWPSHGPATEDPALPVPDQDPGPSSKTASGGGLEP